MAGIQGEGDNGKARVAADALHIVARLHIQDGIGTVAGAASKVSATMRWLGCILSDRADSARVGAGFHGVDGRRIFPHGEGQYAVGFQ